jgi:pimeloyl-ACP methyl ester carboxylesterase
MGERVAYSIHGDGPPLLCVAWWVSHLEGDWQHPGYRQFFGALAKHHTVIRYDRPGTGLSDRERADIDLPSEVKTVEALLDHLELEQVALFAVACAGPPAIAYAAAHPGRVSQLVFFGSFVRGEDVGTSEVRDAMQALVRANWGIGSNTLSDLFAPNLEVSERDFLGRAQRQAASAEMSAKLLAFSFDMHAEEQAIALDRPSLVVHRKGDRTIPFAAGRELAACLKDGSLCSLDGDAHLPWYGDVDAASSAVLKFLVNGAEASTEDEAIAPCSMAREGDLWCVCFDGRQVHLPHALGIADLVQLLQQPGEEVHVGTLWTGTRDSPYQLHQGQSPTLDDEALASYKKRLREIEAEIEDCTTGQLAKRADTLRTEKDMLARELRAAVGLGGRKRGLKDVSERARKAVSARIRGSLTKIEEAHGSLGRHLQKSVTTGTYCCYRPSPEVTWVITT